MARRSVGTIKGLWRRRRSWNLIPRLPEISIDQLRKSSCVLESPKSGKQSFLPDGRNVSRWARNPIEEVSKKMPFFAQTCQRTGRIHIIRENVPVAVALMDPSLENLLRNVGRLLCKGRLSQPPPSSSPWMGLPSSNGIRSEPTCRSPEQWHIGDRIACTTYRRR